MKARDVLYYGFTNLFYLFSKFNKERTFFDEETKKWFKNYGCLIFGSSIILLFVVNIILTALSGRLLFDDDPLTRNFLEDWPNLINYLILCPTYILVSIAFIHNSMGIKQKIYDTNLFKTLEITFNRARQKKLYIFYFILPFILSLLAIAFYGSELEEYKYKFWFENGAGRFEKVVNYYYLFYSIVLLLIILTAASFHFEVFAVAKSFGKKIKSYCIKNNKKDIEELPDELFEKESIKKIFSEYTSLYTLSKILVIIVLINMYTWKAQDPDFWGMLDFTIVALSVLGAAIVSYPRYHIQYWIYKVWKEKDRDEYPDIRNSLSTGFANFADVLILGSAMTNLLLYVLNKANINFEIINLFK